MNDYAMITGAASGVGKAVVSAFLEHGMRVLAADVVDAEKTRSALAGDGLSERLLENVLSVSCDITDEASVQQAIAAGNERLGRLVSCVNCAGIYPPVSLEDADADSCRKIFDVNVLGTVLVSKVAALDMKANGVPGAILLFSSVDAFRASPAQFMYSASKAAVGSLVRSLSIELAPNGIRVNAIAPAWIRTEGAAASGRMVGAEAKIPLGRVSEPGEIADAVWLIAGARRLDFMTGETVVISGGSLIR